MGAHPDQLDRIRELYTAGHFAMPARVVDIGCQQLHHGTRDDVTRFLSAFRSGAKLPDDWESTGRFTGHIFEAAGFRYCSLDIVKAPFVRHFDLNTDRASWRLRGKADLVLNFGTTEHVMNQYNSFRVIHELAKPGGLLYVYLIQSGYGDHGIVRYTDRFISLLIAANGYDVIWDQPQENGGDACRWMVLRKPANRSFQPIVDADP